MGQHTEHEEPIWESPRAHPALNLVALAVAIVTVLGLALTWESGLPRPEGVQVTYDAVHHGQVEQVVIGPCEEAPDSDCRNIEVKMLEGPAEGGLVTIIAPVAQQNSNVSTGERLLMGHIPGGDPGFDYAIADRSREGALLWLLGLFAIVVLILGRLRGLTALVALGASVTILALYVIPALLAGNSPLVTALLAASAIAYLSLYLTHGFNSMTTVAVLGTLGGLAVTASLAVFFTTAANLTGFTSDEAFFVQAMGFAVDMRGMLLAGMIIAGLGVVDDATITQAASIWEIADSQPKATRPTLIKRGLRIGRSHVASMVNTLVLAYAGAAMPVLVILAVSSQSLGQALNGEILAAEIIRTLVGSIGLVLAVPITTLLAARTVTRGRLPAEPSRIRAALTRRRQRERPRPYSIFDEDRGEEP